MDVECLQRERSEQIFLLEALVVAFADKSPMVPFLSQDVRCDSTVEDTHSVPFSSSFKDDSHIALGGDGETVFKEHFLHRRQTAIYFVG